MYLPGGVRDKLKYVVTVASGPGLVAQALCKASRHSSQQS